MDTPSLGISPDQETGPGAEHQAAASDGQTRPVHIKCRVRSGTQGKAPSSCHGRPGSPQVGTKTPGGKFASSGAQAHLSPPKPSEPRNHLPGPQRGSESAAPGPASLWSLHRESSPARHRASSPLIPLSSRSLSVKPQPIKPTSVPDWMGDMHQYEIGS